jgi:hypothetical protein
MVGQRRVHHGLWACETMLMVSYREDDFASAQGPSTDLRQEYETLQTTMGLTAMETGTFLAIT